MKNKKFPKLLHRLPVLLLALILAVMPLTMAVPSHADVLFGSEYTVMSIDLGSVYLPGVHNSVAFCGRIVDDVLICEVFYSEDTLQFVVNSFGTPVVSVPTIFDEYHYASITVDPGDTVLDFRDADFQIATYAHPINGYVILCGGPNTVDFPQTAVVTVAYSEGLLDTVSGVGSWLSGAVQNISTMFWTAESGMTVLGYLAVASLALAVILLIFYLIAGWLKFH